MSVAILALIFTLPVCALVYARPAMDWLVEFRHDDLPSTGTSVAGTGVGNYRVRSEIYIVNKTPLPLIAFLRYQVFPGDCPNGWAGVGQYRLLVVLLPTGGHTIPITVSSETFYGQVKQEGEAACVYVRTRAP